MKNDPIKSKTKSLLAKMNESADTKGDINSSAMETFKNIVFGVLGGGIGTAIIGKASLGVGAVVTGLGHYTGNSLISMLGIGMMSSSIFLKDKPEDADKSFSDKAKGRVKEFGDGLKEKLFIKKKETEDFSQVQRTDIQTPASQDLITETKLSGIDPNIIIDNMEQDLEQAASFYANANSSDAYEDFEEIPNVEQEDFDQDQPQDDSSEDIEDEDLEGLSDDSPIF